MPTSRTSSPYHRDSALVGALAMIVLLWPAMTIAQGSPPAVGTPPTVIPATITAPTTAAAPAAAKPRCPDKDTYWCGDAKTGTCIDMKDICILEPLPGGDTVIHSGSDPFLCYINGCGGGSGLWQWVFGIGIAVAVLQGVVAGFQMTVFGASQMEAAKTRFTWAVAGLLILLLAGVILNFLNPSGFTPG